MLTVVTEADTKNYIQLADLKADLNISHEDDDDFLTRLIAFASRRVDSYCQRVFYLETVTETLRLPRQMLEIHLKREPVVSVTSWIEDGVTLVEDTDFEVDYALAVAYRLDGEDERAAWGKCKHVVTYQGGYALPGEDERTLPEEIEMATAMLAKQWYFDRQRNPTIRAEEVDDLGRIEYGAAALPREVKDLLAGHRRITL